MFHHLNRRAGKGARDSFKRVHVVNDNNEIIKTHVKREMIEEETSKFNTKYFTKVHDAIEHRDNTCKKLRKNCVRDRMLKGQLNREECDDEKVHEFLKLLKRPTEDRRDQEEKIITEKDWIKVIKH